MSYLVLARKYRPQVFEDVVGQAHVTKTLANAISTDRVAHAFLFCGPRGVGKTTAARILAKALNCVEGPRPVPCNVCNACVEITGGRSLDVLEIDGASNRGINEVRELRENTRYAPSGGRFKVYIIDEVHMLTNEAFNALLKTLEEPPKHVVFVLATTEPFKVPGTILSRCQRFDFARIPSRVIAGHVEKLMQEEGIEVSSDAISLVARRAMGGLRDALSLMDQIISAAPGGIDREGVEQILGLVGGDFYHRLVDRLAEQDAGGALELLHQTYTGGADLGELAEGLALYFRDLLLLRIDPGLIDLLEAPESEVPRLKEQAERFSREVLAELVERGAEISASLRRSEHPRLTLELALAEMAEAAGRVPLGEITERLMALETRLGGGPGAVGETVQVREAAGAKRPSPPTRSSGAKTKTPPAAATGKAAEVWNQCLEALREQGSMRLWSMLQSLDALGFSPHGGILLRPKSPSQLLSETLSEASTRSLLAGLLKQYGVDPPRVVLEGEDVPEGSGTKQPGSNPPAPAASDANADPAASGDSKDKPTEKDTRTMGEVFKDEPLLQKALDMFDGEVLP